MAVITLSRQIGSHGEEIATGVAQALGLRLIDAAAINRAAQQAGVPQRALAELEHEGEQGLASQVLKALQIMPSPSPGSDVTTGQGEAPGRPLSRLWAPGLFSPAAPPISASFESYIRVVGLVVQQLAKEGNVLIVGRGGQVLLRRVRGALHLQIVAPFDRRVKTVMIEEKLDKRAASSRVRANDRARADYLRRYHDVDWLDPTLYHLVINTGYIPVAAAVDLIVKAQQALGETSA
jgi:Cytidylate kinase-like family